MFKFTSVRPYLRGGGYGNNPRNPHLKMFNTISAYFYTYSCQLCYHIKQNYCIFYSPKAFCDTHKVLKRRLRPGSALDPVGELTALPGPSSQMGRGHPSPIPTSLDAFVASISAPSTPYFSEVSPKFFPAYGRVLAYNSRPSHSLSLIG